MTRSKQRKLRRERGLSRATLARTTLPIASAIFAALQAAHAADAADADSGALQEVVVTAQKTSENLQNVPIAVEVLSAEKLQQLGITGVDGYVKYSPSVEYVRGIGQAGNAAPGTSHIYMRGVVSGGDGNHSGSQPSVGVYLYEQPVTTIDGTVDVHAYDIERIEVLEGPQGTLYGASSESGTIRLISNKPDPHGFAAGIKLDGNQLQHDGHQGYEIDGFINVPLAPWAAVRLVGWEEHDAGFISNVAGTNAQACIQNGVRTFPNWSGQQNGYNPDYNPGGPSAAFPCPTPGVIGAGAIDNHAYLQNDYNYVDTLGGRASALFELGDSWTVTPSVMGQNMNANGFFGYDPTVGDLQVTHYGPENSQDSWVQAALTVEGKFSNFDLVYAGAYMKRDTHEWADYSDYSEFYDRAWGSGTVWVGNDGLPVDPLQLAYSKGYFQKWSHEIRLTTPKDLPVHGTLGFFIQRQMHNIWQQYLIPGFGFTDPLGSNNPNGFAQDLSVIPGINDIWLTSQQRVDRDRAVFAQATWDITRQLSVTGGIRYYKYDNSLEGFFGFSANYDEFAGLHSGAGVGNSNCLGPATTPGAPCQNLSNEVSDSGNVPRLNLTYRITPDIMVYATWSKGFRPGGVNRSAAADFRLYQPDYLTNYEVGWKTQWLANTLRWNGAVFWEDWKNFQFSYLGPNSLTVVLNGGNARIKGIENEIVWAATRGLMLSANFTLLDPVLTQDLCQEPGVSSCPDEQTGEPYLPGGVWTGPLAPAGTNLPVTPKFKGNVIARYDFPLGEWVPFVQASYVYQSKVAPSLRGDITQIMGMQPAYGLLDFNAGTQKDNLSLQFYITNVTDKRAQLSRFVETVQTIDPQVYVVPTQPRTFGIRLEQKF